MFSPTKKALEDFDNQHDFERMCADILNALGNKDVVLIAPRGGSDDGRDITFTFDNQQKGLACVTLRKDINIKFLEDFSQRTANEYDKYFLFCNAYLNSQQKSKYKKFCKDKLQAELVPQDIEAIRSLLDSAFQSIRRQYLYIEDQEAKRRRDILKQLRNLYVLSHDGISAGFFAGTEPMPKEWIEKELVAKGETWRQEVYY